MRSLLLAAVLLWPAFGQAQQLVAEKVLLNLPVEDVRLIVQVLGQVGCGNVQQLIVCNRAADLLRELQTQVKANMVK